MNILLNKEKIHQLTQTFLHYNSQLNLSAIRDEEGVKHKHIQDSLAITDLDLIQPGMQILDVGTGGGFPLLPLALQYPQTDFLGIDGRRKKINAINAMIQDLGIDNAKAVRGRIEEFDGSFDMIVSRAVAYVDKLLDRSYHLVKKGGLFVLYKQEKKEEKEDLLRILRKKKLQLIQEHRYTLFDGDIPRILYILQK